MSVRRIDSLFERVRGKRVALLAWKAARIAVSPVYVKQRLYLIVHDLSRELPRLEPPPGYVFGNIEMAEVDLLVPLVGRKRVEAYRRRLGFGMLCYAFRKDGEVTNFFWCATSDVVDDILGIRIPVGGGEVYSFDTFTHRDHRHRGLFFSLLVLHLLDLRERGFRRVLATHNPRDMRSVYPRYLAAHIPVDIEKVIDFRRILFLHHVHWSHYHEELSGN